MESFGKGRLDAIASIPIPGEVTPSGGLGKAGARASQRELRRGGNSPSPPPEQLFKPRYRGRIAPWRPACKQVLW